MSDDMTGFVREALGHEPKDPALFEAALTHSSTRGANYERLEFLGDRVLGVVIARWLYERFPDEPEGNLSRRSTPLSTASPAATLAAISAFPLSSASANRHARTARTGATTSLETWWRR